MNLSARATAVALMACAGMGGAVQVATAAPMSADQVGATEQSAAVTRVPFTLPLGSAVEPLTGQTSFAGVHGSLPGMPLVAPVYGAVDDHSLLPDPLVPPLDAAHGTPDLHLVAPAPGGDGGLRQDGLDVLVPQAPIRAVTSAASLGKPLTYTGDVPKAGRADTAATTQTGTDDGAAQDRIELNTLAPALTAPQVESSPSGFVSLDQRTVDRPVVRTVDEFLATAVATSQELQG